MKASLLRFLERFITEERRSNLDLYHRTRMFVGMAWFMLLMSPAYAAGHFVAGTSAHAWAAVAEGLGFLLSIVVFRRTQRLKAAVNLFLVVLFSMLAHKAWLAGGFTLAGAASLSWLLVCPLVATLLLSTWSGIGWAMPTMGVYTLFYASSVTSPAFQSRILPAAEAGIFYSDMLGLGLALVVLGVLFSHGKRLVLEAEQYRAWLASFPEHNPEPVVEVSGDGAVAYLNPSITTLFSDLEEQRLAHPFFSDLEQARRRLQLGNDRSIVHEVDVLGRTYEQRIFQVPGGNIRIYGQDVTKRREYETGLLEAKERAEDMVRLKDAFVANMSHEIRTPLTGILGFASIIADEVPDHLREFVGLISKSGERLQDTLDAVLNLALLEANSLVPRLEPVDVVEEAGEVVRQFESRAAEKGISLQLRETGPERAIILTDRDAVRRIFTNLVDNAIKFTATGTVNVLVQHDDAEVSMKVIDTGIGMHPAFLSQLFTPFKQESQGLNRDFEGPGLGMAITGKLVDLLGGNIRVESTRGSGTAVTVCLPSGG